MKLTNLLIIGLIIVMLFIPMVSAATEFVEQSRGATMRDGAFLVSLGIENIPGLTLTKALLYYNWISMGFLFLVGAMSSKRMTRFFAILIPIFAAIFVFMGWLNAPNPVMTWGTIVMCGLLGVVTYMKGSLKENYGGSGPGSIIVNIVFYLIILQACVGIVNGTGMWENNYAPNQESQFAANADLTQSINTATDTGGWLSSAISTITVSLDMGLAALKLLFSVIISIVFFSSTINTIFPFIAATPQGLLLLAGIQLGIWFAYILFIATIFGKLFPDSVGL